MIAVVAVVVVSAAVSLAYHAGHRAGWEAKTADLRRLNNRRDR
jgi:hypothetical protein